MAIQMTDQTLAIWCIEIRQAGGDEGNWMGFLQRQEKGYLFEYRFRWYVDDKKHDSADRRSFYTIAFNPMTFTPGVAADMEAVRHGREIFEITKTMEGSMSSWELVRGARSMEEFMDALASMPGVSMKKVKSQ